MVTLLIVFSATSAYSQNKTHHSEAGDRARAISVPRTVIAFSFFGGGGELRERIHSDHDPATVQGKIRECYMSRVIF